jgi:hypothetical protein
MNERIRELADDAGFMDSWFSESGDDCEQELKKFAKLIVAECIELAGNHYDACGAVNDIKQHFGVEL